MSKLSPSEARVLNFLKDYSGHIIPTRFLQVVGSNTGQAIKPQSARNMIAKLRRETKARIITIKDQGYQYIGELK